MRRRARRLHLKCRPKVERTTFRHSLIRRDRRARSSRIGAKNAERDGSATTYESTGIVCSGASNSFGGAMMIIFLMVRRDACCCVSASSQKNEDVFVKDDDFLPLFPKIIGWYSSEKVHKVLSSCPNHKYFLKRPRRFGTRTRRLSTFFAFGHVRFVTLNTHSFLLFFPFHPRMKMSSCVHIFFISSSHRLHFICAHPKRHSCNSFRNYSWPSGR